MAKTRTALLVMDFQQGVLASLASAGPAISAAAAAVTAAREFGVPVIFVRVAFRAGYPEVSAANKSFSRLAHGDADFTETSPRTALHPDLAPVQGDIVVVKRRVGAFAGSDLDVVLRAARAETLVLAGIATSGVVLSTLRAAADLDYRLVVLRDACADHDAQVHEVLMEKVFPRQADVLDVAEWARRGVGG